MKYYCYWFVACWLLSCAFGEEAGLVVSPPNDGESVNVGGVIYPAEQMDDPVARRKAEIIAEKIRSMEHVAQSPVSFSNVPMPEVLNSALSTQSNEVWHAALEEFRRRPDEAKSAITESFQMIDPTLSKQLPSVQLLLTRLPQISGALGTEYQRTVVDKALFHPAASGYDSALLSSNGILRYLENTDHDETAILDRLIEDGRLEAGSDLEIEWRRRLSSSKRPGGVRASVGDRELHPRSKEDQGEKGVSGKDYSRTFPVLLVALMILIASIAVWLKKRHASPN